MLKQQTSDGGRHEGTYKSPNFPPILPHNEFWMRGNSLVNQVWRRTLSIFIDVARPPHLVFAVGSSSTRVAVRLWSGIARRPADHKSGMIADRLIVDRADVAANRRKLAAECRTSFADVAPCARAARSFRIAAGGFRAYAPRSVSNGWRHPCSFGLFFCWRHCCRRRAFRPARRMRISSIPRLPPPSARPTRFRRRLIRRLITTVHAPTASHVATPARPSCAPLTTFRI